jgi:Protein kinase domain
VRIFFLGALGFLSASILLAHLERSVRKWLRAAAALVLLPIAFANTIFDLAARGLATISKFFAGSFDGRRRDVKENGIRETRILFNAVHISATVLLAALAIGAAVGDYQLALATLQQLGAEAATETDRLLMQLFTGGYIFAGIGIGTLLLDSFGLSDFFPVLGLNELSKRLRRIVRILLSLLTMLYIASQAILGVFRIALASDGAAPGLGEKSVYVLLPILLSLTAIVCGWAIFYLFAIICTPPVLAAGWGLRAIHAVVAQLLAGVSWAVAEVVDASVGILSAPGRGVWNRLANVRQPLGPLTEPLDLPMLSISMANPFELVGSFSGNTENSFGRIKEIPTSFSEGKIVFGQRYESETLLQRNLLETHLCRDTSRDDTRAVVKAIERRLFEGIHSTEESKMAVKRLEREIRYLQRLSSNHIIGISDDGEDDKYRYFVTPFAEQGDLTRYWPATRRTMTELLVVLTQIASGLRDASDQGIVHLDLKPQNVVVVSDGTAKIIDFGLGAALDGEDVEPFGTRKSRGTEGFASPEQLMRKRGFATQRSDVFSFGALAFWLITGRELPWEVQIGQTTLSVSDFGSVQVSVPFVSFLQNCLAANAEERFPRVTDLQELWPEVLEDLQRLKLSVDADGLVADQMDLPGQRTIQ